MVKKVSVCEWEVAGASLSDQNVALLSLSDGYNAKK